MHYFGIGLHKISLGALILALGLLVDDAIIAVEMMAIKKWNRVQPTQGGELCLEQYGLPDAHGNPDHRCRVSAYCHRSERHREYTRSIFRS